MAKKCSSGLYNHWFEWAVAFSTADPSSVKTKTLVRVNFTEAAPQQLIDRWGGNFKSKCTKEQVLDCIVMVIQPCGVGDLEAQNRRLEMGKA